MTARFVRLGEMQRKTVSFMLDDQSVKAFEGDTLLVAILTNTNRVRNSEFGAETRAGFCMMGACQDCWVWTPSGEHIRACTTVVSNDLTILTHAPELL